MADYRYRIVNVFTDGGPLTGNPLCVFEDARGLDDGTLQALALQFNLSETTFILPATSTAAARVRIFTPAYEMPFAGHPTLGTAFVVDALQNTGGKLALEMKAGLIPVARIDGGAARWQLTANAPKWRDTGVAISALADMLGLNENDIGREPRWISTGREQVVVPVTSREAVDRCSAGKVRLGSLKSAEGASMAYVFHDDGREVYARFFLPGNGAVLEDPATGSACANLGGWFLAQQSQLPLQRVVSQGSHVGRPSKLYLTVDAQKTVRVAGDVVQLAVGVMSLQAT